MTRFHSPIELEAFWEPEDVPHGPGGATWKAPESRYKAALGGILALSTDQPHALLLQSIAARALGDDALSDRLFDRSRGET